MTRLWGTRNPATTVSDVNSIPKIGIPSVFRTPSPVQREIAHPKGHISAFFQARFMPKPVKRTTYQGYDKTKDMVFRE
jgi:hypothetical protein